MGASSGPATGAPTRYSALYGQRLDLPPYAARVRRRDADRLRLQLIADRIPSIAPDARRD